MEKLDLPKQKDFGFGPLMELKYLEQVFGITRRIANNYLKVLHLKPFYIKDEVYFSLPTLKRILFVLSLPGSPGFMFPGSKAKNDPRKLKDKNLIKEVTEDILKKASNPKILAEMIASEGRDPSILKSFVNQPTGRPRKENEE